MLRLINHIAKKNYPDKKMCSSLAKNELIIYDLAMPFISLCPAGGRSRSPYCESASRSERDTSIEVVVVQSTSRGKSPINCSQATLSTEKYSSYSY